MEIVQIKPKKANFLLVVFLSSLAGLVILIAAYMLMHWDGKNLVPEQTPKHPDSRLVMPLAGAPVQLG
ncbi:MAG: hypothetical protein ABI142_10090 [Bryocella sp.]